MMENASKLLPSIRSHLDALHRNDVQLEERSKHAIYEKYADRLPNTAFPIPLLFVATKYDAIQVDSSFSI
jgi:hypothetical protein